MERMCVAAWCARMQRREDDDDDDGSGQVIGGKDSFRPWVG